MLTTVGQIKRLISESATIDLEKYLVDDWRKKLLEAGLCTEDGEPIAHEEIDQELASNMVHHVLTNSKLGNERVTKFLGAGIHNTVFLLESGFVAKIELYYGAFGHNSYDSRKLDQIWQGKATAGDEMIYDEEVVTIPGYFLESYNGPNVPLSVRISYVEHIPKTLRDWVIEKGLKDPDQRFAGGNGDLFASEEILERVFEVDDDKRSAFIDSLLKNPAAVRKLVRRVMPSSKFAFAEELEYLNQSLRYIRNNPDEYFDDWEYRNIGVTPANNAAGVRFVFYDVGM